MADERGWFEVRIVLRTSRERIDQAQAWLEDMGLAEINRIDVVALDDDLRRWDGGRPPGVVVDPPLATGGLVDAAQLPRIGERGCSLGMPEPAPDVLDRIPPNPVFDDLRRGIHLHES